MCIFVLKLRLLFLSSVNFIVLKNNAIEPANIYTVGMAKYVFKMYREIQDERNLH